MFLLRDRLLTMMYMASFVVLLMLCTSLPIIKKLTALMQYPPDVAMVIDKGKGP